MLTETTTHSCYHYLIKMLLCQILEKFAPKIENLAEGPAGSKFRKGAV